MSEQAANDYDTGVSNGDVDWLFRGKSKKLTKKMDKERKDGVEEPEREASVGDDSVKEGQKDERRAVQPAPPPAPERSFKLDRFKLGRSRSSSTGSTNFQANETALPPQQPYSGKRRSSLNFISAANQPMASQATTNTTAAATISTAGGLLASQEASPNVSRSNSASGKTRSLFSSLSAKFKSNPSAGSGQLNSSNSPVSNTSPKLNPNLLGVSHNHTNSIPSQDLAALVDKPPPGIPVNSKRRTSVTKAASHHASQASSLLKNVSIDSANNRRLLNKNPKRDGAPLDELHNINLRRITFSIDRLAYDPQQQIPSRRPKKGNVLVPEDIVAPPPRLLQGISLSDSNGNKTNVHQDPKYSEKELLLAIDAQKRALLEADKHANEAHLAARRIALEVSRYKLRHTSKQKLEDDDDEVDDGLSTGAQKIEIDKPLHMYENHFENLEAEDARHDKNGTGHNDEEEENIVNNLTLETIYTRCCHLREILPIPATLKQLKNKSKPLQVLKLLNPKPTLIDVLSFSDFIAITPINTIIFDNVTMTTEMLRHFLSSLVHSKSLEKLSLRNVAIDERGWKYLCKFLSRNLTIKKLDISQQRIKSDTKKACIRSSMNWNLFIHSLVQRGGIEELVINGCKLSDEDFKDLIENAVKLSTYRLGIASIELNKFKANIVANWITDENSKCVGVDVAFNDMGNGQLQPFIHAFQNGNPRLIFFSLNSTKLTDVGETSELIKSLSNIKTLRFLDLSSLPELFPGIISRLNKYLPLFPSLKRIHFDLNDLSSQSIGAIADILPKIEGLVHVSFLGNKNLNQGSAATLYAAVKLSNSIFTLDLDYDLIPDKLSQRIAFYLMRNMDRTMNSDGVINSSNSDNANQEELMFDGSLLMETAEKLLIENDKTSDTKADLKIQKIITNALIERTRAVRKDIHQNIDNLFQKRNEGTLSLEGKETLLRLCLLDSSLEKVVLMFEEQDKSYGLNNVASSPSPSFNVADNRNNKLQQQNSDLTNPLNLVNANPINKTNDLLNVHDNLHQSSNELITAGPILSPQNVERLNQQSYFNGIEQNFQPHQVVIDSSSDGKYVPIDNLTGRPVLMRSISHTSTHAKEQEREEGELHRWGVFMEQRKNNDDEVQDSNNSKDNLGSQYHHNRDLPTLNVLPSGSELRDAIIAAKGIESITDLIENINDNRVSIDKIYENVPNTLREENNKYASSHSPVQSPMQKLTVDNPRHYKTDDNDSINSIDLESCNINCKDQRVNAVVDEVYDKLLNDAERVRSNKQE